MPLLSLLLMVLFLVLTIVPSQQMFWNALEVSLPRLAHDVEIKLGARTHYSEIKPIGNCSGDRGHYCLIFDSVKRGLKIDSRLG